MQVSLQNRMNYSIFMIMYIQVMHEHSMGACNTIHYEYFPSHSLDSYFSFSGRETISKLYSTP